MKRKPVHRMSSAAELRVALAETTDVIRGIRTRGMMGQDPSKFHGPALMTVEERGYLSVAIAALFRAEELLLERLTRAEPDAEG